MKRWLLPALTLFVIAGGLAIFAGRSGRSWDEPSYNKRSLSSWLEDFSWRPIGGGLHHDNLANELRRDQQGFPGTTIRAMGTNVTATLLREIKRPDDPPWLATVKATLNKQKLFTFHMRDPQTRRERAALAFYELGPAGVEALPELANLLTNYSSAVYAAHALAGMGTNAIPVFESALTNSNTWIVDCGVWGLAQMGTESRITVPQILPFLQRGNTADIMLTLWALGEIREPSEVIRAELVRQLAHSDPSLRKFAAEALCKFGADARPALDQIKTALDREDDTNARTALQKLIEEVGQDGAPFSPATPLSPH